MSRLKESVSTVKTQLETCHSFLAFLPTLETGERASGTPAGGSDGPTADGNWKGKKKRRG